MKGSNGLALGGMKEQQGRQLIKHLMFCQGVAGEDILS